MTDETKHETISLSEFASRATEGEATEQELDDGSIVALRVFAPEQDILIAAQKLMTRLAKLAAMASRPTDISEDDAMIPYELGFLCLRGCVRDEKGAEIPEAAVADLFRRLPYKSALMLKCQDLVGVSMMVIPPLKGDVAIKAMQAEAKAAVEAAAKESAPNGKTRRKAAKKG